MLMPIIERHKIRADRWLAAAFVAVGGMIAGCETVTPISSVTQILQPSRPRDSTAEQFRVLNRITWGANESAARQIAASGIERYIDQQLRAAPTVPLAPTAQAQIDAMTITRRPLLELVFELEQRRQDVNKVADDEQKKKAQEAFGQEMNRIAREAAQRSLLRAVYSPNQIHEQMVWFWMNHFSVHQYKSNIRALLGDYEERAIRPHALGRFRALLGAAARHPAMLRYLDNEQNAVNRINENYARELMELHTLGAGGGYTQQDIQELARVLTGVGVNVTPKQPSVRKELQSQYVRDGLFEYNPNRHDYGDKVFLGQPVKGRGLAELDEALDRLARHPSTARYISRKLAIYFAQDDPPAQLVSRMAQTFQSTDGDIAQTLRTLFMSQEFQQSLGRKFKDPMHYVVSAVRLAYDDKPILNATPMINWLNRMGQPLYARETPDGYPMTQSAWSSPGQMTMRFEIARAIGSGSAGLFKAEGPQPAERPAFPQLANALFYQSMHKTLSPATRQALDQANSPQEWNTYLLSSPEFMNR